MAANFDPNDPAQLKAATDLLNAPYTGPDDYESREAERKARLASLGLVDLPMTNPQETGARYGAIIFSESAVAELADPVKQAELEILIDQISTGDYAPPMVTSTTTALTDAEANALFAEEEAVDDTAADAVDDEYGDTDWTGTDADVTEEDALDAEEEINLEEDEAGNTEEDNAEDIFNDPYPAETNGDVTDETTSEEDVKADARAKSINQMVNQAIANVKAIRNEVMNPLHAYASYTYGISLHALTVKDYNKLVAGTPGKFRPSKTLVSTASRYKKERDVAFRDDFYFDDLKIETIIGMNSGTQGTNGIQMSFTLIEPYGLTFLNRLLDISVSELNAKNYLDIPYLLEINFFGADDTGKMEEVPNQTKWIPIKLLEMKIKAGVKGSEYQMSAVPYNHTALSESAVSTPANFEITAKTVGEFFSSESLSKEEQASVNAAYTAKNPPAKDDAVRTKPAAGAPATPNNDTSSGNEVTYDEMGNPIGNTGTGSSDTRQATTAAKTNSETNATPPSPPVVNSKSYTSAYNAWQVQAQKKTEVQEFPNIIQFIIDDEIKNSSIVYDKKNTSDKTPNKETTDNNSKIKSQDKKTQATTPATGPDFSKSLFNVNAGDTIISIVNQVLLNSEYIIKQIKDPTKNKATSAEAISVQEDKPIDWFKIIPQIEIQGFDRKRNEWAKKITYYIKKFRYFNTKDKRANQARPPGFVKQYNYIYTGENIDIIDFEIDFNTLYYTAIESDLAKTESLNKAEDTKGEDAVKNTTDYQKTDTAMPAMTKSRSGSVKNSGLNKTTDSSKTQAASVAQSFYSSPRGDMLNLKLKIVGDPHFIKQDDVYVHPGTPGAEVPHGIDPRTGSLVMDAEEIYAMVRFRTPVDIDEATGLYQFGLTANKTGKTVESNFSGYYRIMTVSSEFRGGQFTQTIDLIRQFNQEGDTAATSKDSSASANSKAQRTEPDQLADMCKNPAVRGAADTSAVPILKAGTYDEFGNPVDPFAVDAADEDFGSEPEDWPTNSEDNEDIDTGWEEDPDGDDADLADIASADDEIEIPDDNLYDDGEPVVQEEDMTDWL